MIARCSQSVAFVAVATFGIADAKPIFLRVDHVLARARLVAEVTVEHVEAAAWMGEGGERGSIRVRVTDDLARIFVGHDLRGRTLTLGPPGYGPSSATHDLGERVSGETCLVALDESGETIVLVGSRAAGGAWSLHGFCDYNACLLHSDTPDTGAPDPASSFPQEHFLCSEAQLRRMTRAARVARIAAAARLLVEPPRMDPGDVSRRIAQLTHADAAVRGMAHQILVEEGFLNVRQVAEAASFSNDDLRAALDAVLDELAVWHQALPLADDLRDTPKATARAMLAEVDLDLLDPRVKRLVRAWIDALAE